MIKGRLRKNLLVQFAILLSGLIGWVIQTPGQAVKRNRADALWFSLPSNTVGKGNLWIKGYGNAFLWDNGGEASNNFYPFPNLMGQFGVLNYLQVEGSMLGIGYGYKVPGDIRLGMKITWPDKGKVRLFGPALALNYTHSFVDEFPSIGGFRIKGTGFSNQGILRQGGNLSFKGIMDLELITLYSWLPFKIYFNFGYEMGLDRRYSQLDEIPMSAGFEAKFFTTDAFVEYNVKFLKGLFWFGDSLLMKKIPRPTTAYNIHYSELPHNMSIGTRIKYPNGFSIKAGAVLGLFKEKGFTVDVEDKNIQAQIIKTGASDGFSPFYANWQIFGEMALPIKFKMTSSELYRNFILLKNKRENKKRDIEGLLKKKGDKENDEDKKRLDKIEKRRKALTHENLLD